MDLNNFRRNFRRISVGFYIDFMKIHLITVEESNEVDANYSSSSTKQIKVKEVDADINPGEGVYVHFNDMTLLVSGDFINHFSHLFER